MGDRSRIGWTDATWNPVVGCSIVHRGCYRCYAAAQSFRNECMGHGRYAGLTIEQKPPAIERGVAPRHFNGVVNPAPQVLEDPLRWARSRMVFTCSMSDLFHEKVPDEYLDQVFAVMAIAKQHVYQVLTKRPRRAALYIEDRMRIGPKWRITSAVIDRFIALGVIKERLPDDFREPPWPLPNAWLGTSPCDQATADELVPELLQAPAAVHFLSIEPMLGPVDIRRLWDCVAGRRIRWVILGVESLGTLAGRLGDFGSETQWCEAAGCVVRQCSDLGIPVFVKQVPVRGRVVKDLEQFPGPLRVQEWPDEGGR